jgi:hypothetical protein
MTASGEGDAMIRWTATSGPVDLQAAAADGTPKQPTFKINAYNGGVMRLGGWFNPVIIDLAGMKAMSQSIPIFLDHDSTRIVGQTSGVKIDASGVNLEGAITGGMDDPDVKKVVGHSKGGFKWQASIGANPTRKEFLEPGKTATVNGQNVQGPLIIARESLLVETSFVAIGADITTSADIAATHKSAKDTDMNFSAWLKAKGIDETKIDDATKAVLKAAFDGEVVKAGTAKPEATATNTSNQTGTQEPTKPAKMDDLGAILAAAKIEGDRQRKIGEMTARVAGDRPDLADELKAASDHALQNNVSVSDYEVTMIRIAMAAPKGINFNRGQGDRANDAKVIEAAICASAGLENMEKKFDAPTLEAADRHYGRNFSILDTLFASAKRNGYTGHRAEVTSEFLRMAFDRPMRGSGVSTLSVPNILSNVANKFLTQAFDAVEQTWRQISAIRSVRDFKQITSVTMTGDFLFKKLPADGQIKHAVPGETTYNNQADTYARMIAISRKDLINDDVGALAQAAQRIGRGAALALNTEFWTQFMDNASFFTANRGNYDEDTDTALAITGLTLADTLFLNQTDPDGNPLGLSARYLLVPPALKATALQLMNSTEIRTSEALTSGGSQFGVANPYAQAYTPLVSTYLSNANFTGASSKAWYLLASPMDLPVIEVAFLNGNQTPVIDSAEADFDQLGIKIRGYYDFGVAKQEYRAGVKMAGENI